jgi:putative protease
MILSTQLPEDKLIACCKELGTECEVLGAGKILLFYSKRHLLQANFRNDEEGNDAHWIYADSASEESASRPFPTIENEHGTFMYLNKDHFILDSLARLDEAGMHTIRIDLRDLQAGEHAAKGIESICAMTLARDPALDTVWTRPTSAPFFKRNRTDKQFARMKPQTRLLRDAKCVAEVVSVERGEVLGLFTLRAFDSQGASFKFVAHDGSELPATLERFSDVTGNTLTECAAHKVVRCSWVKGVKAGAILVRDEAV